MFGIFKYIKSWFVTEIEESIEDLMKQYINRKLLVGRSNGWIKSVDKETEFIKKIGLMACDLKSLEDRGVKYIPDTKEIGTFDIQWDYQYDSVTTFTKNGGYCNSINRISQVYSHNQGKVSYLVTYISKDPTKNHTTCIYQDRDTGHFYDYDYGVEGYGHESLKACVDTIAEKYKTEVLHYIVQDIDWSFRKI